MRVIFTRSEKLKPVWHLLNSCLASVQMFILLYIKFKKSSTTTLQLLLRHNTCYISISFHIYASVTIWYINIHQPIRQLIRHLLLRLLIKDNLLSRDPQWSFQIATQESVPRLHELIYDSGTICSTLSLLPTHTHTHTCPLALTRIMHNLLDLLTSILRIHTFTSDTSIFYVFSGPLHRKYNTAKPHWQRLWGTRQYSLWYLDLWYLDLLSKAHIN